jgi:hypothetical protein
MDSFTIWKTVLKPVDVQDIDVPENADLLTAREQHDELCVWFKCNPKNKPTKRRIAIVGTGHAAPAGARYVGTGFLHGGQLVLHVFERVSADLSPAVTNSDANPE